MDDPVYSNRIVTDTQRRLIAALVMMKEGKNPPNEFPLYSVHRNHVARGMLAVTSTPYHE
jgi:hypothetical protein